MWCTSGHSWFKWQKKWAQNEFKMTFRGIDTNSRRVCGQWRRKGVAENTRNYYMKKVFSKEIQGHTRMNAARYRLDKTHVETKKIVCSAKTTTTRAEPGKPRSLELHSGHLHNFQRPRYLAHHLLLYQTHEQDTGSEIEQLHLKLQDNVKVHLRSENFKHLS